MKNARGQNLWLNQFLFIRICFCPTHHRLHLQHVVHSTKGIFVLWILAASANYKSVLADSVTRLRKTGPLWRQIYLTHQALAQRLARLVIASEVCHLLPCVKFLKGDIQPHRYKLINNYSNFYIQLVNSQISNIYLAFRNGGGTRYTFISYEVLIRIFYSTLWCCVNLKIFLSKWSICHFVFCMHN